MQANARGMHYIYFCAPSARAPELMLALPYMSWGTHDGMPTLPWGEGMRILMLMHTMDTDVAEAACVVQSTPQVEKLAPGFDLVVSKLDLSAVVAWPVFVKAVAAAKAQVDPGMLCIQADWLMEGDPLDGYGEHRIAQYLAGEDAAIMAERVSTVNAQPGKT